MSTTTAAVVLQQPSPTNLPPRQFSSLFNQEELQCSSERRPLLLEVAGLLRRLVHSLPVVGQSHMLYICMYVPMKRLLLQRGCRKDQDFYRVGCKYVGFLKTIFPFATFGATGSEIESSQDMVVLLKLCSTTYNLLNY
jgi:hypothetical protein